MRAVRSPDFRWTTTVTELPGLICARDVDVLFARYFVFAVKWIVTDKECSVFKVSLVAVIALTVPCRR